MVLSAKPKSFSLQKSNTLHFYNLKNWLHILIAVVEWILMDLQTIVLTIIIPFLSSLVFSVRKNGNPVPKGNAYRTAQNFCHHWIVKLYSPQKVFNSWGTEYPKPDIASFVSKSSSDTAFFALCWNGLAEL